jgi:hypothetical protein
VLLFDDLRVQVIHVIDFPVVDLPLSSSSCLFTPQLLRSRKLNSPLNCSSPSHVRNLSGSHSHLHSFTLFLQPFSKKMRN